MALGLCQKFRYFVFDEPWKPFVSLLKQPRFESNIPSTRASSKYGKPIRNREIFWMINENPYSTLFLNTGSVLPAKYQWHFPVKRLWLFLLQVLVAVLPRTEMMYFDTEEKQWKQLSSLAPVASDVLNCYCAETVGRQLFVTGNIEGVGYSTYSYDVETNKWQRHEDDHPRGQISSLCTVGD